MQKIIKLWREGKGGKRREGGPGLGRRMEEGGEGRREGGEEDQPYQFSWSLAIQ